MKRSFLSFIASIMLMGCSHTPIPSINADAETETIKMAGDVVDDPAIWVHPTHPEKSLIIGTHKKGGGLEVYELSGKRIQSLVDGKFNNVDLRYGMSIAGKKVDIIAASNRTDDTLALYGIEADTRKLYPLNSSKISTLDKSYGLCMYHEAVSDSYYVFVNSKSGEVVQLQLFTNAQDQIDAKVVRQFSVGSQTEGCVVDDAFNTLYIGEENVGIWKYGANPTDGQRRSKIDSTSGEGHLSADVEGLALYAVGAQEGYLLASSQGENAYTLYSRKDGSYLGKFEITDGVVDGTCETDGIAVTSSFLGDKYPEGILVVQDGEDTPSLRQNFKIIDFSRIKKQVLSAH